MYPDKHVPFSLEGLRITNLCLHILNPKGWSKLEQEQEKDVITEEMLDKPGCYTK